MKLTEVEKEVIESGHDLKNSTHVFGRSLRQNPLTGDNVSNSVQPLIGLVHFVPSEIIIIYKLRYKSRISKTKDFKSQ
jgi:hypothetical protein